MGVNDWSQAERDLYALGTRVLFDDMERQRREWREGVALDTTATDAILAEAAARTRAVQEETRRYLASLAGDDGPVPAQDVAGGRSDASGPSPASGQGPRQPNHTAELTADDINAMSLEEFSALRARIGMGNASGRGLFG